MFESFSFDTSPCHSCVFEQRRRLLLSGGRYLAELSFDQHSEVFDRGQARSVACCQAMSPSLKSLGTSLSTSPGSSKRDEPKIIPARKCLDMSGKSLALVCELFSFSL